MRKESVFSCYGCGKHIEFGSTNAICYSNEIYCCEDCLHDVLGIDYYDWSDAYEYSYTKDESNGYGVLYITDDYYSNGHYIIFDKCGLNLSDDERGYFTVSDTPTESVERSISLFKEIFDKSYSNGLFKALGRDKISTSLHGVVIDGVSFSEEVFDFVCRKIKKSEGAIEYYIQDDVLYLICEGTKAVIKGDR